MLPDRKKEQKLLIYILYITAHHKVSKYKMS